MPFDYGYTCGEIDNSIDAYKTDLKNQLDDLLDECCPMLEGGQKENFIKGYVNSIYDDFSNAFEGARHSNVDMRAEADSQIDILEATVEDLESTIIDKEAEYEELENKLTEI